MWTALPVVNCSITKADTYRDMVEGLKIVLDNKTSDTLQNDKHFNKNQNNLLNQYIFTPF